MCPILPPELPVVPTAGNSCASCTDFRDLQQAVFYFQDVCATYSCKLFRTSYITIVEIGTDSK